MIIYTYPVLILFYLLTWLVPPGFMKQNKDYDAAVECLNKHSSETHKVCPDCLVEYPYPRSISQEEASIATPVASV